MRKKVLHFFCMHKNKIKFTFINHSLNLQNTYNSTRLYMFIIYNLVLCEITHSQQIIIYILMAKYYFVTDFVLYF